MEVMQEQYKDTKIGRIPKDWEVMQLNEITNYKSSNLSLNKLEENTGKYKLYGASGVLKGVDFYQTDNESFAIVKDGSGFGNLLWCDANSSILGTLGRITNKESSDLKFCFYLAHTIKFKRYMSGSTIPHLYYKDYGNIKLPVPTLPEQQKIAAILSTVDEQINTTDKIIEKSKELKKGLMQKLFSEGIGHTEFKDTKIGRIPKEWEVIKLGEYGNLKNGANFSTNDVGQGKIMINVKDLYNLKPFVKIVNETRIKNINDSYLLNEGDLLFVRSSLVRDGVGYSAMYRDLGEPSVFSGFIIRVRIASDKIFNPFIAYYLRSGIGRKNIISLSGTVTITNIGQDSLSLLPIPLTSLPEQQKIAAILSEADAKIEKEQTQKIQLKQLKKGLMQQLLTGKKRVA